MSAELVFINHFRGWLERSAGCEFANYLSSKARVAYQVVLEALRAEEMPGVDAFFDQAAEAKTTAVIIAPQVRSPVEIAKLLKVLMTSHRWKCSRLDWRHHAQSDSELVQVSWQTLHGKTSGVMGFAPLGSMPVTRRAPYVALGLWPGDHENPHKKSRPGTVGFIDAAHGLSAKKHEALWKTTDQRVREILKTPPEDVERWRAAAFALPTATLDSVSL